MAEISDMDWAQHIKMDYAQNLRKDPKKAKQTTFRKFKEPIINESNEMYWNPMKSNHEIYTVLWKYVTRFPLLNNLLHIFCVGIAKIARFKLFNKIAQFCDDPFTYTYVVKIDIFKSFRTLDALIKEILATKGAKVEFKAIFSNKMFSFSVR